MVRQPLRLLALLALVVGAVSCGHRYHYRERGLHAVPFTLTLVNDSSDDLIPGPIVAQPGSLLLTDLPTVPPGRSLDVAIGYVPSTITISAIATDGATYVYPTVLLQEGIDFSFDASGVVYVFR